MMETCERLIGAAVIRRHGVQ